MFIKIPSFNSTTYGSSDFLTKLGQVPDDGYHQPHEVDQFILRGPEILFWDGRGERSLGYADFRPSVLRQVAVEHLGMVLAETFAAAENARQDQADRAERLSGELRTARDTLTAVLIERNDLSDALRAAEQALTEREVDLQVALARAEKAEKALAAVKPAPKARPKGSDA